MKKVVAVAFACVLQSWIVGCGGGGSSPVVEYNAAIQALDRNLKLEAEFERIAKNPPDEKTGRMATENLARVRATNEKLRGEIERYSVH